MIDTYIGRYIIRLPGVKKDDVLYTMKKKEMLRGAAKNQKSPIGIGV